MKKQNERLGGWLLFFFIVFIVLTASAFLSIIQLFFSPSLYDSFSAAVDIPQPGTAFLLVNALLLLIKGGMYLFATISIGQKKRSGVSLAIWATWVGFAVAFIQQLIAFAYFPAYSSGFGGGLITPGQLSILLIVQIVFNSVIGIAWALGVTFYFLKSKRVKETLVR